LHDKRSRSVVTMKRDAYATILPLQVGFKKHGQSGIEITDWWPNLATCVDDISSRDAWLDGDQWLLGKSMPGFCPVGPSLVTADELDPTRLRLGCTVNGVAIQDGSTDQLRFSIAEVVAFLSAHVPLEPGDIIATGTPARLAGPYPPDRHLEPGDVATVWIEGIGELTTHIA